MQITKKQHIAKLKDNKAIATRLADAEVFAEKGYCKISFERIGNGYGHSKNVYDCHVVDIFSPYRIKIKVYSSDRISVWYNPEEDDYTIGLVYNSEDFESEEEAIRWLNSEERPLFE